MVPIDLEGSLQLWHQYRNAVRNMLLSTPTQVYAHILDEDRKVNAQKFEMAFYANADLRGVEQRLRAESAVAEPDSEILLKQLEAKPELMDAFTKKFVEQYGEQIMNQLAKKLIGA